jgi:uncharacterized protein (TIGR02246 family)
MSDRAAASPTELSPLFTDLFARGEMEELAALYTEDALFVPGPGQEARGRMEIAAALSAMRNAGATIELETRRVDVAGDVAVLSNTATVYGLNPDGSPLVAPTTELLRRQPDGTWLYAVDNPFFSI